MQISKKQELAKKAIMDSCSTCKGYGCRECASRIAYIDVLSNANIPSKYWNYNIDTFHGDPLFKKVVVDKLSSIDKLYNDGVSIIFTGKMGVGKTWGGIEILKHALIHKYDALYTTMNEIIDLLTSKDDKHAFKKVLQSVSFLMIDEFDGRYMPQSEYGQEIFGSNLENVIRTRLQNNLPMIICTNNSDVLKIFSGVFEQTFNSLFSSDSFITIPVGGLDLRIK